MDYRYNHGQNYTHENSSENSLMDPRADGQEERPDERYRNNNQYNDFVHQYPQNHEQDLRHTYGNESEAAAVGSSEQLGSYAYQTQNHMERFNVPSINVYQAPQPIPMAEDTVVPMPASNLTVSNDQLYNMGYEPRSSSAQSSVGEDFPQDTQPILNHHRRPPPTSGPTAVAPDFHRPTDFFSYDHENSIDYIDQNGDDYQINTFYDNNNQMANPYSSAFDLNEYADNGVYSDEYSSMDYDDQQSRDLGDYAYNSNEDANTLARVQSSTNLLHEGDGEDVVIDNGREKFESNFGASEGQGHNPMRKPTTVRKFKLSMGNFVFDCPISENLITQYVKAVDDQNKLSNEFKFMRYQAVTCEPLMFQSNNFTLRQLKYGLPRQTELMIVITMYNEDDVLLGRTLKGVMDNIRHFTKKKHSSTWGPDAWKKIVVCVVSDGRSKINERSLALMSALGCYQDGFAKGEINDKKVIAHVYEHTSKVNIRSIKDGIVELECGENTVPIQLLFCLKENNQKKINSHRWALEAFGEVLQPTVVNLLDAGTMPGKDSIYELWREFKNPQVGGACGEIKTDLGRGFKNLFNPLVASQNFEYKLSNILDKTTESNFGFITVLPGAFSAYRFEAIRGEPLRKYFLGDDLNARVFISNMYLAEDRILCFEIVTKKDSNWILRYSKSSYGSTDVPEKIPEFILQRRRWMNGAFFAALYSFLHFYKIWSSGHSFIRKLMLNLQFIYLFLTSLISWFSLSSFFLVFRILTISVAVSYNDQQVFRVLSVVFLWLYGVSILITFILSLGNKPKGTSKFYLSTFIFFAILMVYMIFCSIFMSVHSIQNIIEAGDITFKSLILQETFRDLIVSMGSTYCLYVLSSVIYLQPMHMLTSFVQYLLLSPSYINVLNIYAFCNVHDISWGTKGFAVKPLGKIHSKEDGTVKLEIPVSAKEIDENYQKHWALLKSTPSEEQEEEVSFEEKKTNYYAMVRSLVIILWVISNFVIVAVVLETGGISQYESLNKNSGSSTSVTTTVSILPQRSTIYFSVILWLVAFMAAFRFLGCCVYLTQRFFQRFKFRS
ncbi:LANO_0H04126g1_1 [Lachancea nothofagi CBS 11611]|uniref:chitin synthase n=1 Tax=Lachancea nothofagi CBS 11611 TaxID=1266666 RepID=A0A1G4KLC2_9SACH|nr:LANO_0H04126g1_1 [Lachancea nothofagi CBS 11611]